VITIYKVWQKQEKEQYFEDWYRSNPVSYREIVIGWFADKTEAKKRLAEAQEATEDYCSINEIIIPKEVLEEALKMSGLEHI
jgi:hypothetical protein